ncbi:hypothetical protein TL16_g09378 [Triparma laevis f. inornata]|uniref:Uncharacterized protein n=1 Tax=Triparma laevis f. inornata TaxID=1714386 RepID=A0A9W7BAW2_9STRA|nr:hypothetical protein TL16_g09378 [Triparma laevis f. inornata]
MDLTARLHMSYTGDLANVRAHAGIRHGQGKYKYSDFYSYEGNWSNGVKDGKGKFTLHDLSTYEGDMLDGEITGEGIRTYTNGDTYKGSFLNGERCGYGEFLDAKNGSTYKGSWMNNKREGKGKLTWGEGSDFVEGVFQNHKVQGVGIEVHTNCVYKGEFKEGKYDGKGKAHFRAGSTGETKGIYEGEWKNGDRDGFGTHNCKVTGVSYEGLRKYRRGQEEEVKGKKGKEDGPVFEPLLEIKVGEEVPKITARCITLQPPGSGKNQTQSQSSLKSGSSSTTSLALAPPAAKQESGRRLKITLRQVDVEAKDKYEAEFAEKQESDEAVKEIPHMIIPPYVGDTPIDFFLRLPTTAEQSTFDRRGKTLRSVERGLVGFFETTVDSLTSAELVVGEGSDPLEPTEVGGNACASWDGANSLATPSLLSFGSPDDAAGSMAICIDFFLPQASAQEEISDENAEEAPASPPQTLVQSQFLSVALVKSQYFQVTTSENSWSLPPTNMEQNAWHSLSVSTSGSGVPTVVVDGKVIANGVQDEEKLQNLSPSKQPPLMEEDAELNSGEEKKEGGVDYGIALGQIGTSGLSFKNLGVWAAKLGKEELIACSSVYTQLRTDEVECQARNDAIQAEYEARAQVVRNEWEAAEEKVGKEPDVIGAIRDAPEARDRSDMVKEFIGVVDEGECIFDRLVMPGRIEKGFYAWVVEDVAGVAGADEEGYLSPFVTLPGGSLVMTVG